MKPYLFILLIFFYLDSLQVLATKKSKDEKDESVSKYRIISEHFFEGSYLIYDCRSSYWVCVDEDSYLGCRQLRDSAIMSKEINLVCAPIKKLYSLESCIIEQKYAIENIIKNDFCFSKF